MKNLFVRFVREEEGQDLIEYALLAALIARCVRRRDERCVGTDINGVLRQDQHRPGGCVVVSGATLSGSLGVAPHSRHG